MTLPKKQLRGRTDGEQTPELNLPVTKFVYPERKSMRSNGLRYLRWGGDGEAVQPEKGSGV